MRRARTWELAALGLCAVILAGCGKKPELMSLPATPTRLNVALPGIPGAVEAPPRA